MGNDSIVNFALFIIKYFKNDYIVIADFLRGDSPWDLQIMSRFNINKQELDKLKRSVVKHILGIYYKNTIELINLGMEEKINSIDLRYIDNLRYNNNPVSSFLDDDICCIQILRYYISYLQESFDVPINSYNNYVFDIVSLFSLYDELLKEMEYSNHKGEILQSELFDITLCYRFRKYIEESFRNEEEQKKFVNYFVSVVYAYIKTYDDIDETEELIVELLENGMDFYENFQDEDSLLSKSLEVLYNCYVNNQYEFDMRKNVDGAKEQELFVQMDEYYGIDDNPDEIFNTYISEFKLGKVYNVLKNFYNMEELYEVLLNNESIYNFLFNFGLDARYSNYYKEKLIRKIIADVYAYEIYKENISDYQPIHVNNIKNLNKDLECIIDYFIDHGLSLIDIFEEFMNSSENEKEKIRLNFYEKKELKTIDKIYDWSLINYFQIMLGNIKKLDSVDCMNYFLTKFIEESKHNKGFVLDLGKYNFVEMIKVMCLNVYENILLLTDGQRTSKMNLLVNVIDNKDDYLNIILNSEKYISMLVTLFLNFNVEQITYQTEIKRRNKVLNLNRETIKKLNPFGNEL